MPAQESRRGQEYHQYSTCQQQQEVCWINNSHTTWIWLQGMRGRNPSCLHLVICYSGSTKTIPVHTWEIHSFHPVSCFQHLPVSSSSQTSKFKMQNKFRKEIIFQGGKKISFLARFFFFLFKVVCRQLVTLKLRLSYEKYSANKLGSNLLLNST